MSIKTEEHKIPIVYERENKIHLTFPIHLYHHHKHIFRKFEYIL